jgi:hypothetical protein
VGSGLIVISTGTSGTSIKFAGNGVGDVRQLLLLLLEVLAGGCGGILLKPVSGLLDSLENLHCN